MRKAFVLQKAMVSGAEVVHRQRAPLPLAPSACQEVPESTVGQQQNRLFPWVETPEDGEPISS